MLEHHGIDGIEGSVAISGIVDETLDLQDYLTAGDQPIKLNLSGVKAMSSIGIHRLRRIMAHVGAENIEFHECSLAVLDAINTFPGLLGTPARPERVKSVYLPFCCSRCGQFQQRLFQTSQTVCGSSKFKTPCHHCPGELRLVGDPRDYFLYLACRD